MPHLELSEFNTVCATLAGYFLVFNLISSLIRDLLYVNDALISLFIGVAFGPYGAGFIHPGTYGSVEHILLEFARLVLAVQLVLTGVQLPAGYIMQGSHWWSMFMMLVPVMVSSWLISALIIFLLVPNINYIHAMVIGACLTPTDPVNANAIIRGAFAMKYVPKNVRLLIAAESGANDGMGYPYMYLALYLLRYPAGKAIGVWMYESVLYSVAISLIYGIFVGYVFRKVLRFAKDKGFADIESVSVYGIVLALFILGTSGLVGIDDLLACFAAGKAFAWDGWFQSITSDDSLQTTVDFVLYNTFYLFFGAQINWGAFNLPEASWWRLTVITVCVFVFKRIPPMVAFYKLIPTVKSFKQALFIGHFGAVGVGAVYYAGISVKTLRELDGEGTAITAKIIIPVTQFLVVSSMIIHGLSIPIYKVGDNIDDFVRKPHERAAKKWRARRANRRLRTIVTDEIDDFKEMGRKHSHSHSSSPQREEEVSPENQV